MSFDDLAERTGISYKKTSTSILTGENVTVYYGGSYFTGFEYKVLEPTSALCGSWNTDLDQVTIAPGFVIQNQSIADALSWIYFGGVDDAPAGL